MISILSSPHVTSLLWAVSGSHLILCLKSIGITWSPEQNDSLRFLRTTCSGQMFVPGQGDGIFLLMHGGCNPAGRRGGAGRSPLRVSAAPRSPAQLVPGVGWGRTGSLWPPTYGGFWDLCFWGSMAAEGLRRPAGLRDPVRLGSNPPPLLNARSCTQSHLNKAVLLLLGQPTCCPSELRSTQSCLYREAYFSMQKYISPRWFFRHNLESLLLKMWLAAR